MSFNAVNGLSGSIIPAHIASVSNPPITLDIPPLTLAVVFMKLAILVPQVSVFPNSAPAPPMPPIIAPLIAPEKAPSSKPSRNDPPDNTLEIPPNKPPEPAPINAPIAAAPRIPPTPVHIRAIAAMQITTVAISFQWSLHQSPTFFKPSQNFSQSDFSHSGFR